MNFQKQNIILQKMSDKLKYIYKSLIVDEKAEKFIRHNKKIWGNWLNSIDNKSKGEILVDLYSVGETIISYSYFVNVLARQCNAQIKSFSPPAKLRKRSLHRIYQSFNTVDHVITNLNDDQRQRADYIRNAIMPQLKTKRDIYELRVLGIWVGVDVYETYLREGAPTIDVSDPRVVVLVRDAIELVVYWQDYFAKNLVAAVVVSHDIYIYNDIVCKVAYENKVPVYLPNVRGITLARKPYSVYAYMDKYHSMFRHLAIHDQERGILLAKKQLEIRFSGQLYSDMEYNTKSAFHSQFKQNRVLKENDKIKVLICCHCFFDNPHAYGGLLFLDFYEWLCFLGKIAERTEYDWYIKVHPDPMPGTIETIQRIIEQFPRITMVPYDTSHHQLVQEGINFVLTAYGTVGHEYPAMGVQVINAGYNPHVAYDFNWHPKTIEEYQHLLLNLNTLHKEMSLEELYEFYFMHYYYTVADSLIFTSYKQMVSDLSMKNRLGSGIYQYFLEQLTPAKHQEIINNMQRYIESGKHYYFEMQEQDDC